MSDESASNDHRRHTRNSTALARERTRLAQERTTLAHVRTGFSSLLFGIALVRLFDDDLSNAVGGAFVLIGVVFAFTGGVSYLRSRRRIAHVLRELRGRGL